MSDVTSGAGTGATGPLNTWFGHPRTTQTTRGEQSDVVTAAADAWDDGHRRRLLQTSTIPGLVPTVALKRTFESVDAHQLPAPGRTLLQSIDSRSISNAADLLAVTEAASRATHSAHLAGLFHGAVQADDVYLIGTDVAVSGFGLGTGGTPESARRAVVAPEVLASGTATVKGDVYSLGKMLETSLGKVSGPIAADVQTVIDSATHTNPDQRPPSARAVADRLQPLIGRRRRRYGLAALGSSAGAVALGEALNGRDDAAPPSSTTGASPTTPSSPTRPAAATAAGATAAGATTAATTGAAASAATGRAATTGAATTGAAATTPTAAGTTAASAGASGGGRKGAALALAALLVAGGVGLWALSRGSDDEADDLVADVESDADDTSSDADSDSETVAESTTTETETTAAPSTTAAPATTAAPSTTVASDDEEEADAVDGDDGDDAAPPPAGLLNADQASESFEILHAVPGIEVDAYVDGMLAAPGFTPGTLAGPLPLSASGQPLDLFLAQPNPPALLDDRADEPVLGGPISMDGPGTLVAFIDDSGTPMLQTFGNNLDPVPAGQGRLAVRHVAAIGPATVELDGDVVANSVPAGSSIVVEVPAGSHQIRVIDSDGNEVLSQEVDAVEGELTSAWIRGGDGAEVTTSVRRIGGLETAPAGIPSGNAGLAASSSAPRALAPSLAIMAVLGGLGLTVQRRRAIAGTSTRS